MSDVIVSGGRASFLAVVHAETPEQVLRNVARALDSGADGVFLINHVISSAALIEAYVLARAEHPRAWLGLSFMGCDPVSSFEIVPPEASGLWVADACTTEDPGRPLAAAVRADALRKASGWQGAYFGGVAFKHQRPVDDVGAAAAGALAWVDVVTTSGAATGMAPAVDKIARMKEAVGDRPLAVASGVTPANAADFVGLADYLMVATGVSDSDAELSATKMRQLVQALS